MENFGYVFATKMLVDNKLPVMFMYREEGLGEDSGWRFFAGVEDQEYVDNPDNIAIYDINTILSFDESIRPYLNSLPGSAFERFDCKEAFEKIHDFAFGADLDEM